MIKVIVADDEYKVCQLICKLIEWDKLDMKLVGTASNGIDALKMIEVERPDLVLTDIRMPGCDGIELLKKAKSMNSQVEFIIISGYSHFEYAQAAIHCGVCDYILKPVNKEQLNGTLMKVRQRHMEKLKQVEEINEQKQQKATDILKFRKALWHDVISSKKEMTRDEINEKYYYQFKEGIYQIFFIQMNLSDDYDAPDTYVNNTSELLPVKVTGIVEKYLKPVCLETEIFFRDNCMYGIANFRNADFEAIHDAYNNMIENVCHEMSTFEHLEFHMSISECFEDVSELFSHYEQCEQSMGERIFREDVRLLKKVVSDVEYNEDKLLQPYSVEVQKSFDLQSENILETAVIKLHEEANKINLNGSQLIKLVKKAYRLFLLSSIFCDEFHFSNRDEMEVVFNKRVLLCNNENSLFEYLIKRCKENLSEACSWENKEKMRPINQAKEYIQNHYSEQISLETVSSYVGFSPSYFSTIFSKETGKTFLEYLLDIRIEEAKKLLRETQMNIEMVCLSVGSNDYKRFTKKFKKEAGITPKEYRNLYSYTKGN